MESLFILLEAFRRYTKKKCFKQKGIANYGDQVSQDTGTRTQQLIKTHYDATIISNVVKIEILPRIGRGLRDCNSRIASWIIRSYHREKLYVCAY